MNETLFDVVCAYLDGDIDAQAWEQELATHGDALNKLLVEEQAVRQQIRDLAPRSMPAALRERLQQIPQHSQAGHISLPAGETDSDVIALAAKISETNLKNNNSNSDKQKTKQALLFPIFVSFATMAACLAIVCSAIFLSPSDTESHLDSLAMNDDTYQQASPMAAEADMDSTASGPRDGMDHKRKITQSGELEIEVINEKPNEENSAKELMKQPGANAMLSDSMSVEGMSAGMNQHAAPVRTEKAERKDAQNSRTVSPSAQKQLLSANTDKSIAPDSAAIKAPMPATTMPPHASAAAQSDQAAPETDGAINDEELQAALSEARNNVAQDARLRQSKKSQTATATAKTEKQVLAEKADQLSVAQQLLDTQTAQEKTSADFASAPTLHLKLSATAKDSFYVLGVSMDSVDIEWFKAAILDMKLVARDAQLNIIWTSPVLTQQMTPDVIELRSNGLAPPQAQHLVLQSLNQFSNQVALPLTTATETQTGDTEARPEALLDKAAP